MGWYVDGLPGGQAFADHINRLESTAEQATAVEHWFSAQSAVLPHTGLPNCDNPRQDIAHQQAA
jgi:hypothetical protein